MMVSVSMSTLVLVLLLVLSANAFVRSPCTQRATSSLFDGSNNFNQEIFNRRYLMETSERLAKENGKLIVDNPEAKRDLLKAVTDLEDSADQSAPKESDLLGDWKLIVSTSTIKDQKPPSLESLLPEPLLRPLQDLRAKLLDPNQYIEIQQRVRSDDGLQISRIDHVIQYTTPLDVMWNAPNQTKLILVHKASWTAPRATKLELQSVILNVAGKSQTVGEDVASINLPLGGGAGDFETTYLAGGLRVSRGKVGPLETVRVFSKETAEDDVVEEADDVAEDVVVEDVIVDAETIEATEDSRTSDGGDE